MSHALLIHFKDKITMKRYIYNNDTLLETVDSDDFSTIIEFYRYIRKQVAFYKRQENSTIKYSNKKKQYFSTNFEYWSKLVLTV